MARFSKYIKTLMAVLLCGITFASCDNSDDIGDLYGMWHLTELTYNDETIHPNNLFICFQSQYVDARKVGKYGSANAFGHYTHKDGMMTMTFYYCEEPAPGNPASDPNNAAAFLWDYRFIDDSPATEPSGITPVRMTFKVEAYSSSCLVLSNEKGRWCFKKSAM